MTSFAYFERHTVSFISVAENLAIASKNICEETLKINSYEYFVLFLSKSYICAFLLLRSPDKDNLLQIQETDRQTVRWQDNAAYGTTGTVADWEMLQNWINPCNGLQIDFLLRYFFLFPRIRPLHTEHISLAFQLLHHFFATWRFPFRLGAQLPGHFCHDHTCCFFINFFPAADFHIDGSFVLANWHGFADYGEH